MPAPPVDHVVRYGAHPEQLADVRLPMSDEPRALVLLVHGGFWRQEYDRHHTDALAADLAGRGYAVASLEYRRLGGDGGWPETFDDIATAMDALPSLVAGNAPEVEGVQVLMLGHSAGGQLVLWAAGRQHVPVGSRWHRGTAPIAGGVVALAPVADLARARELALDGGVVAELFGGTDAESQRRQAELDPVQIPPAVPVAVVHGDLDRQVPLDLSQRYVEAVRTGGGDVLLDVVPGADHFAVIEPGSSAWPRVLSAIERMADARHWRSRPDC